MGVTEQGVKYWEEIRWFNKAEGTSHHIFNDNNCDFDLARKKFFEISVTLKNDSKMLQFEGKR